MKLLLHLKNEILNKVTSVQARHLPILEGLVHQLQEQHASVTTRIGTGDGSNKSPAVYGLTWAGLRFAEGRDHCIGYPELRFRNALLRAAR